MDVEREVGTPEREVGTPEREIGTPEREVGSPDAMDFQILTFIFHCL